MRKLRTLLACLVFGVLAFSTSAFGAAFFSTDFAGPGLDSNLQEDAAPGVYTIDGTAYLTSSPESGDSKQYIKTVDTNYNTTDWVYDIYFTDDQTTGAGIVHVGLGDGVRSSWYGVVNQGIYLAYEPNGHRLVVQARTSTGYATTLYVGLTGLTVHDMAIWSRITKSGTNLKFEADVRPADSVFTPNFSYTVDLTTYSYWENYDATNSRLFFGTGSALVTFDNMSVVVPEPTTMMLLLLGLPLALRRRRQKIS